MATAKLASEELAGLGVAIAAHVALVALLVLRPPSPAPLVLPERMTVTLSDEAALTSTSPEPMAQPAPDEASTIGEQPRPAPSSEPQPVVKPLPRAVARAVPRPPVVAKIAAKVPAPPRSVATPPRRPAAPAGGSRIDNDFLKGVSGTRTTGTATNPPAAAAGPQVRASLAGAVLRQVRPNWQGQVPQGVNTDKIVTVLSIELNPDGTLARTPTVVRQEGVDDSNRAQAQRHAEVAIRAVQRSAPFDLPTELYASWKNLPPLRFRKTI